MVAEAFALAAKVGVDLEVLLEIMSGSAASSWMLKDRGPRMLQAEPGVRVLMLRDNGAELRGEDLLVPAGKRGKRALS